MQFDFVRSMVAATPVERRKFAALAPGEVSVGTYFRYAMAGAICCGVTHAAVVPLGM